MSQQVYHTAVIGGGIVGASTAYALARRGHSVLLLDQFTAGHSRGSSHGDGRILRFNYPEAIYVDMARLAYPAWDELANVAGQSFTQKTGLIEFSRRGSYMIEENAVNLTNHQIPFERLNASALHQRFPLLAFDDDSEGIYQGDGAVVYASRAVVALWKLAGDHGATLRGYVRIADIQPGDDLIQISTANGDTWQCERLVITAGGWAVKLLASLGLDIPLSVTQEQVSYFASADDSDHRAGHFPVVLEYQGEQVFYSLPQIDVPGVKAGWHHTGPEIDADHPQPLQPDLTNAVSGWVKRRFAHLIPEPIEEITCLYTNTPDHHFILDVHPQYPNIVIGAGFSGHGFKFGPVLGEILAALALNNTPPLALDTFSISRFENTSTLNRRTGA